MLAGLLRGRTGLPAAAAAPARPALTVVIIDDDPCAREVLRIVLSEGRQWRVVGEAADGHEGIVVVGRLRPQLAVLAALAS